MPDRNHSEPDGSEPAASEPAGQPDQTLDDERARLDRHVDEQEEDSFPASDPHADWSGPSFGGRDLPEAVTKG
jgi:hypothetical protein